VTREFGEIEGNEQLPYEDERPGPEEERAERALQFLLAAKLGEVCGVAGGGRGPCATLRPRPIPVHTYPASKEVVDSEARQDNAGELQPSPIARGGIS
jgi:hypothetical protein